MDRPESHHGNAPLPPVILRSRRFGKRVTGDTISGHVRLHERFRSKALGNKRNVVVYLPPAYGSLRATAPSLERFPVLYLHDGQNVFDARTSAYGVEWGLDAHAERLIGARRVANVIMVGVYNTGDSRMAEYTPPWTNRPNTGRADAYAEFLLDELKPFIDSTYRTRPEGEHTGILGSSLGGLCALYLGLRHPRAFSRIGAVSPSLWFAQGRMLTWLPETLPKAADPPPSGWEAPRRVWLCGGTEEGQPRDGRPPYLIESIRWLRRSMLLKGYREGEHLFYLEVPGGRHDEHSWSLRAPRMLEALFPAAN